MTVGQHIRERRSELKMTLKQLATAADLSIAYLSDVERDKAEPPLKSLIKIAEGLQTSAIALLDGVDNVGTIQDELIPEGLRQLRASAFGTEIDDEWLLTLKKVDFRGKRPQSFDEWLELHMTLKRLLKDKNT